MVGTVAAVSMMILILDGKRALNGAAEGIDLCIRTVIPSLFPFFILSIGLVTNWTGLAIPPLQRIGKIMRIPPGMESLLIPGFLGGYPVGAQAIAESYRRKQITAATAERSAAFCNNAGPAFIFGIISQFFPDIGYCWIIWGVHIASAVLVAAVLPCREPREVSLLAAKSTTLSEIMDRALRATVTVCGWVVIFRVILTFLDQWLFWFLPVSVRPLISGTIELTNGCCELGSISHIGLRMIIAVVILSLGGLSVWMQTASVLSGLSIRIFIFGKLLQAVFSAVLMLLLQLLLPTEFRCVSELNIIMIVAAGILLLGLCIFFVNRCSNPEKTVV